MTYVNYELLSWVNFRALMNEYIYLYIQIYLCLRSHNIDSKYHVNIPHLLLICKHVI